MAESTGIVSIDAPEIRNLIHTARYQVMLDSDLAMLYGVETKRINEAVSRNPSSFPERFRLTKEKADSLKSQFVTSNEIGRGGRRKLPFVLNLKEDWYQ